MTRRPPFWLVVALLLVGCEQAPPLDPPTALDLDGIAQSVALALADPATRADVRDAMRESPWTEHKLSLHEFLQSPSGRSVLHGAARAAGISAPAFAARVGELPEMDFYMPVRDHRLSWRGTGDVLVGATYDVDGSEIVAFSVDGRSQILTADGGAPEVAVLVLHPAEPRHKRMEPQTTTAGQVIQEGSDEELAGSWTGTLPNGTVATMDLSELMAQRRGGGIGTMDLCPPDSTDPACSDPRDPPPPDDSEPNPKDGTTYLDGFEVWFHDSWWGGASELKFRGRINVEGSSTAYWGDWSISNVSAHQWYNPRVAWVPDKISASTDKLWVEVMEYDENNNIRGRGSWYPRDNAAPKNFYEFDNGWGDPTGVLTASW